MISPWVFLELQIVTGGLYMTIKQRRLVCTNHECGAEFIVLKKPAAGNQNLRCACGSEIKKYYHAPEFRISEGNTRAANNNLQILNQS
jgi:hypothetical protein